LHAADSINVTEMLLKLNYSRHNHDSLGQNREDAEQKSYENKTKKK